MTAATQFRDHRAHFLTNGWCVFPAEPGVKQWVAAVKDAAHQATRNPEFRAVWLRHGGTWFAGVDALDSDGRGRVGGGPELRSAALDMAVSLYGPIALNPAQVSVVFPGYPIKDPTETEGQHRFRVARDAAHVDGLKLQDGRRVTSEFHAFVLGVPLDDCAASPLVVWSGSHQIMRQALATLPHLGPGADVTEVYTRTRARVFDQCPRVEVRGAPGQVYLVHRLALHGIAPWGNGRGDRRAVVYFRPHLSGSAEEWIAAP